MQSPFADIARAAAESEGLRPDLVYSIITVESAWDTFRVRYEPGWKWGLHFFREHASRLYITPETEEVLQKTSWGLMQIIGVNCRELGYTGHLTALCDPAVGLHWGCKMLKKFYQRYGDEMDAVAAYNCGTSKKTDAGMYRSQRYVDKVYAELLKLQRK